MNELAFKLASEGATNPEIFGACNITSGALQALMQTNPQLLFSILNGRAQYTKQFRELLEQWAIGEEPLTKVQYSACVAILDKAESQNRLLCTAHELVMIAGQVAIAQEETRDPATVTQLLRKSK